MRFKRFLLYEAIGLIAYGIVTIGHPEDLRWNTQQFAAYTSGVLLVMVSSALNRMKPEE